jgi:hypothetical protein
VHAGAHADDVDDAVVVSDSGVVVVLEIVVDMMNEPDDVSCGCWVVVPEIRSRNNIGMQSVGEWSIL